MPASRNTTESKISLLVGGADLFPAMMQAFETAQHEIWVETYIFSLDHSAQAIKTSLMAAAARGVQVRLITDWHGTGQHVITELNLDLLPAGVAHRCFNPWFKRGYTRTHRKLCVVDQKTAFVGGINITDDYLCDFDSSRSLSAPRWDFAVQIEGPLVIEVSLELEKQWHRIGAVDWQDILAKPRSIPRLPKLPTMPHLRSIAKIRRYDKSAPLTASFLVRNNFRNRRTIQNAYMKAIKAAQNEILLATPYFAPSKKFIKTLAQAAQRGVQVTLLIGVGQFGFSDAVAHAFYPTLLSSGVRLVEYQKTQLHAKVAVVDGKWATVGSSNWDALSLFLNHEANVIIKDHGFAQQLQEHLLVAIAESVPIELASFQNTSLHKRVGYRLAYWLYRGMMTVATRGRYN